MSQPPFDITPRHLAKVVESSDDAIVSKDLNSTIISWNHAAERMFGYTAAEAIGRSIRIIIPADRQGEEDIVLAEISAGRAVTHYETIRQHRDGTLFAVSLTVSPIYDDAGKVVGASKIARDIRERKQADFAARRLAAVITSSDDAIITKNLDGTITTWNAAAERMFGYTEAEAIGRSIRMLIPADRQGEEDTVVAKLRAGETIDHYETIRCRKDGSEISISLTVSRSGMRPARSSARRRSRGTSPSSFASGRRRANMPRTRQDSAKSARSSRRASIATPSCRRSPTSRRS